jgi:hypothetical protein
VNVVLTTMRQYVDPQTLYAVKDETRPQLMQLVSDLDVLADAAPAPGPGASMSIPLSQGGSVVDAIWSMAGCHA